jgi:dolichol-phosphate mannosyltransferase
MKVAVLIPTYNEAGAIGNLFDEMAPIFAANPAHEWHVVVIDANSPDGTADVVRAKALQYPNVHLIVEKEKRGIAMAYITGMRYAIDELKADAFVEFDGDGQHDPRDIVRLIDALESGYDYAIGSRYVAGGAIPKEWAAYRKILSRFGSLYARLLLELPVYDATSGLKATRTSVAKYLPLEEGQLLSKQYAYKLQFLYALSRANVRIKEIPIVFRIREHDISKSAWYDILESLRLTLLMRLQTLREWRFLRVVGVGLFGFACQTLIFGILGVRLGLIMPSNAILLGGEFAILSNFFLNERFSFSDKQKSVPFVQRIVRFHLVSLGSIVIQWVLVKSAESFAPTNHPLLWVAYISGLACGLITNYTGYYFWVWRR